MTHLFLYSYIYQSRFSSLCNIRVYLAILMVVVILHFLSAPIIAEVKKSDLSNSLSVRFSLIFLSYFSFFVVLILGNFFNLIFQSFHWISDLWPYFFLNSKFCLMVLFWHHTDLVSWLILLSCNTELVFKTIRVPQRFYFGGCFWRKDFFLPLQKFLQSLGLIDSLLVLKNRLLWITCITWYMWMSDDPARCFSGNSWEPTLQVSFGMGYIPVIE